MQKGDVIYRQAAIDAVHEEFDDVPVWDEEGKTTADEFERIIDRLPSVQPDYTYCANAMLAMWMDKVLTDGEYSRIMDKLNAHWAGRRTDEC